MDETLNRKLRMLDLKIDPKLAWALKNRDRFPVDVNTADREALLCVPGLCVGVRAVDRIDLLQRLALQPT